jgi:tetratricopeptide (TPR) repeat protein
VNDAEPRFTDYGDDGDVASARRARRSFRLSVFSVLLLTLSAWIGESQLRYSRAESNFLTGITHERGPAQVFLQSAIRQDAEATDTPTAKYTQALAVRQDDDVALETYARAYELDPKNSLFAIRYGCRLFQLNRAQRAAELFRSTRGLPPANSLPRYLEAAAIAQGGRDLAALGEAMVIVSRANNTPDPIVYPKPIWFSGYPQSGTQYARLSREIFTESCAPLYALTQQVALAAQREDAAGQGQDVTTWLRQIAEMGRRLVVDGDPKGTLQATAGASIQLQALQSIEARLRREGETDSAELSRLAERQIQLRQALDLLKDFETNRDEEIAGVYREYRQPLLLILSTAIGLSGVYLLARLIHAVSRYRKTAWTVPHGALGKAILSLGAVALFGLLAGAGLLQRWSGSQPWHLGVIQSLWWAVVLVLIGFGLVYPALRVPSPEQVSGKSSRLEDIPDVMRHARQAYRRVYIAFVVRYFGILAGTFLCTACLWVLLYRVSNGLYPWQINLLASGMLPRELDVVRQAMRLLGPA